MSVTEELAAEQDPDPEQLVQLDNSEFLDRKMVDDFELHRNLQEDFLSHTVNVVVADLFLQQDKFLAETVDCVVCIVVAS